MADLATPPLSDEKEKDVLALVEQQQAEAWEPSAIVADIATLGAGTLLAGVFNVALVFVVPKLLSVEDYGYWRMFALYAGYAGFLHLGFADGALLRWAGRPMEEFRHELWPAMRYLFWQHLAIIVPGCVLAMLLVTGPLRFVAVAIGLFALMFNQATLLQYGLQSGKLFRPVAISTVGAPALFLGLALLWHARWKSDYREVTGFYGLGWFIALGFLLMWTKPWASRHDRVAPHKLGKQCVLSGWPIMIANMGVTVGAYADRLAVNWAATIQDFAQYSLAASAMAVPLMAIQACSKVFFPHLAGVTAEGRKRIYGISSRMLLIAWTILLPYFFGLSVFVRRFLPRYIPSLQYARIMLLGIPFVAVILILHMSYAYLHGIQRQFLALSMGALAVSLGVTSFAAFHARSFAVVAGVQVATLGVWWLVSEGTLRNLTGERLRGWMQFLGIYGAASAGYWIVSMQTKLSAPSSVLIYYAYLGLALAAGCRSELAVLLRIWKGRRLRASL